MILFLTDPVLTVLALGQPAVPQRARHALLAPAAPGGDGHPAGVGRAGRGGRGDRRRRAGREGLRRRAGAGGPPADRGRRRVRPLDGGRRCAGHASCRRSSCCPTSASSPILGYGGHQVLDGNLTLGELVAFNVYVVMLIWPLRMLGMIIAQGQRSAAAGRAGATRSSSTDPGDRRQPQRRPAAGRRARRAGAARCASTACASPTRPSCRWCSTASTSSCPPGQSVALVGATGSRQDHRRPADPALLRRRRRRGAASTASTCATLRLRELRKAVGIVFEDTFLFSDTIAANIAFADPDASLEADRAGGPARRRRRVHRGRCPRATTR